MPNNNSIIGLKNERLDDYKSNEIKLAFETLRLSFQAAAKNIKQVKKFKFEIANRVICLNFAGEGVYALLTKALEHLVTNGEKDADVNFFIWDHLTTGQNLPVLIDVLVKCAYQAPWITRRGNRNELYDLTSEEVFSSLYGETVLTSFNSAENTGIYWASGPEAVPFYEIGAPLRMPLSWYFSSPDKQLLHSGAVGDSQGGVLLSGKGGSGKSTVALRCLDSSLFYAGDDYTLVSIGEGEIIGYSLFNTAKVKTSEDLDRFANLNLQAENADKILTEHEKPIMFLAAQKPEKLIRSMPLKAIVFPRFVTGETARLIPVSPQSAFKSLVDSNVMQSPHVDKVSMTMISRLTKRLPAYLLVFGENQTEIPDLISGVLAKKIN